MATATAPSMVLPDAFSASWITSDGRRREFFRAALDTVEFYVRGAP